MAWCPLRTAIVLAFGLALLTANPISAQRPQSPPRPLQSNPGTSFKFQVDVNRVIVDVVVTDSSSKPVRGLTQKDFSIYEDGEPQNVLSFDVHSLDSNPTYFAKLPPMPPNTFVNIATEPERGPLYVLLLDLVNTAPDDQMYARQQLLKFIESKPQGTRFAVFVVSDGLHLVQGFTADRTRLYATLDTSHSIPHVPRVFLLGCNNGVDDPVTTVSVFKAIALYLEGLPGRKNIIWVSGLFPLDLFPHDNGQLDTSQEARETLDAITRSDSSIYPVDVTGARVLSPGALQGPAGFPDCPVNMSVSTNYMIEDVVAEKTGGRAFYSRNDLKDMLEEATEAGSEYYTLTYSPSNRKFDGKTHAIRVELDKKGYHLEYRRAYLATGPQSPILPARYEDRKADESAKLRPIGDSLSAYMQHGAPTAREVYFRAHVRASDSPHLATADQMENLVDQPTYFQWRHKKHPKKPLAPIKLQSYQIDYQIIARIPNLEVAAGVYDNEGRLLNGDVEEASSGNPKTSDARAKFTYFRVQQRIDVPETAVSLRLGVRDLSTDRMGTMEISLPLPPEPLSDAQTSVPSAEKPVSQQE